MTSIEMLRQMGESAERLFQKHYPFDAREHARRGGAFNRELWQIFADDGWLVAAIPEEDGGIGDNPAIISVLARSMGRALMLEPWLGSAVLASRALFVAGEPGQRAAWLPRLMDGTLIAALAYNEARARNSGSCRDHRAPVVSRISDKRSQDHGARRYRK